MKLLICAVVVGALTLFSLTTSASVINHSTYSINAPPSYSVEYDKYWELYLPGYQGSLRSYVNASGQVKTLTRGTEGFNQSVALEIDNRFSKSIMDLYELYFEPIHGEEHLGTPMPEVATRFHERLVRGREGVAIDEEVIRSLVEDEEPALLPRLQEILALANTDMTDVWVPTAAYLEQFLPGP